MGQVTFVGACGTVTGSCTLLELGGTRAARRLRPLPGRRGARAAQLEPLPLPAAGRSTRSCSPTPTSTTPASCRGSSAQGYGGPVYCTRPTRPLAGLVLEDAGELQEEEARFAKKKGYSRHADPRPLFTRRDAQQALRPARAAPSSATSTRSRPASTVRYVRAGHLLGAASIEIAREERARRAPALAASPATSAATTCRSCTTRSRRPRRPTRCCSSRPTATATIPTRIRPRQLAEIIRRTFDRGGCVLIPAFALGRTQDLLFHLSSSRSPAASIPTPSSSTARWRSSATEIYRQADAGVRRRDPGAAPGRRQPARRRPLPALPHGRRVEGAQRAPRAGGDRRRERHGDRRPHRPPPRQPAARPAGTRSSSSATRPPAPAAGRSLDGATVDLDPRPAGPGGGGDRPDAGPLGARRLRRAAALVPGAARQAAAHLPQPRRGPGAQGPRRGDRRAGLAAPRAAARRHPRPTGEAAARARRWRRSLRSRTPCSRARAGRSARSPSCGAPCARRTTTVSASSPRRSPSRACSRWCRCWR